MTIEEYIATVQGVEISHHIQRDRPFLVPKPQLTSWEQVEEEELNGLFTRAIIAGLIVTTALWVWVLAMGMHWVAIHVWQAMGHQVWMHLLGGLLSDGRSV